MRIYEAGLIKFLLDLTSKLLGYRRFGLPVRQDLIERLALEIFSQRCSHVRTDLSLAGNTLEALDEFVRKADRDPFHTIIIRLYLLKCSGDHPNVGAVCPYVARGSG
jgi:hypothetical protein